MDWEKYWLKYVVNDELMYLRRYVLDKVQKVTISKI